MGRSDDTGLRVSRMWVGDEELMVVSTSTVSDRTLQALGLTAAEGEVARLVMDGRSNAEVALARGTSERTVANQLAAIFDKLEVSSRQELAAVCLGLRERGTEAPSAEPNRADDGRAGQRRHPATKPGPKDPSANT